MRSGVLVVDDTIEACRRSMPAWRAWSNCAASAATTWRKSPEIMSLPDYTVRRDWRKARALLLAEMGQ